jgi:hypothetical protein
MPQGCKRHHLREEGKREAGGRLQQHWKRDVWGEANLRAGQSVEECQARKRAFDAWCGVTDTIMLLLPPQESLPEVLEDVEPLEVPGIGLQAEDYFDQGEPEEKQGQPTAGDRHRYREQPGEERSGDTDEQFPEGAPALPSGTGCFVWLPSGCKSTLPLHAKYHWRRDTSGEETARAGESADACRARKRVYDSFCGVEDAVMLPIVAAPD